MNVNSSSCLFFCYCFRYYHPRDELLLSYHQEKEWMKRSPLEYYIKETKNVLLFYFKMMSCLVRDSQVCLFIKYLKLEQMCYYVSLLSFICQLFLCFFSFTSWKTNFQPGCVFHRKKTKLFLLIQNYQIKFLKSTTQKKSMEGKS